MLLDNYQSNFENKGYVRFYNVTPLFDRYEKGIGFINSYISEATHEGKLMELFHQITISTGDEDTNFFNESQYLIFLGFMKEFNEKYSVSKKVVDVNNTKFYTNIYINRAIDINDIEPIINLDLDNLLQMITDNYYTYREKFLTDKLIEFGKNNNLIEKKFDNEEFELSGIISTNKDFEQHIIISYSFVDFHYTYSVLTKIVSTENFNEETVTKFIEKYEKFHLFNVDNIEITNDIKLAELVCMITDLDYENMIDCYNIIKENLFTID